MQQPSCWTVATVSWEVNRKPSSPCEIAMGLLGVDFSFPYEDQFAILCDLDMAKPYRQVLKLRRSASK